MSAGTAIGKHVWDEICGRTSRVFTRGNIEAGPQKRGDEADGVAASWSAMLRSSITTAGTAKLGAAVRSCSCVWISWDDGNN